MDSEVLSIEEARHRLHISRGLAYRLANEGKLPVLRLGRRLLVPKPALEEMLRDPQAFAERRERDEEAEK